METMSLLFLSLIIKEASMNIKNAVLIALSAISKELNKEEQK